MGNCGHQEVAKDVEVLNKRGKQGHAIDTMAMVALEYGPLLYSLESNRPSERSVVNISGRSGHDSDRMAVHGKIQATNSHQQFSLLLAPLGGHGHMCPVNSESDIDYSPPHLAAQRAQHIPNSYHNPNTDRRDRHACTK